METPPKSHRSCSMTCDGLQGVSLASLSLKSGKGSQSHGIISPLSPNPQESVGSEVTSWPLAALPTGPLQAAAHVLLPRCDLFHTVAQVGCCYFCLCCRAQRFLQKHRTCQLLMAPYKVYFLFLLAFPPTILTKSEHEWMALIGANSKQCLPPAATPGNSFSEVRDTPHCSQPASTRGPILRVGTRGASHMRPLVSYFLASLAAYRRAIAQLATTSQSSLFVVSILSNLPALWYLPAIPNWHVGCSGGHCGRGYVQSGE